ncbi:MAG: CoA-binding protein [Desulfobacteraceae bacterium]
MEKGGISSNLRVLFKPASVAVIGASENEEKLGFHVMKGLTTGNFGGKIIPVNPKSKEVMGIRSYSSVAEFEGPIDLAVVVVPAPLVQGIFEECIRKDIKGIVLITAGFKESDDPQSAKSQDRLADLMGRAGIPVIGPNTFGVVNLHQNLNASFTPELSLLRKGGVALVSQSGGISHLMAFMAMKLQIPISKVIGLGNRLNIDFAETVAYLMEDPDTRVIVLYLEGLDDPRGLMKISRENLGKKPLIAYKGGSAKMADQISLSHTGSMAGKNEIYEGALRQSGILVLHTMEALLDLARALFSCPLPRGNRVGILSAQAGPGMVACDVCEREGLEMARFSDQTHRVINEILPPIVHRSNPVDMGPVFSDPASTEAIIGAVLKDENVDGIVLITLFASANREVLGGLGDLLLEWKQQKPVIASLISPPGIWDEQIDFLEEAEALANFPTPERAARVMAHLWQYKNIKDRMENG